MMPKTNENLAEEDTSTRPRTRSQTRGMSGSNATQEQNNSPTTTDRVMNVPDNLTPRETDAETGSFNLSEQVVANSPPHIESPAPLTLTEDDVGLSKKTGARLVMVAGGIKSDEYESNEDLYEGEDGDEVMERTKKEVWEHDKKLKTYIGQMYATKFEAEAINNKLDRNDEKAEENDRQRREDHANLEMKFEAMLAQMKMDREIIMAEMTTIKSAVNSIKEDLKMKFNKSNDEWRKEQMKKMDEKMDETIKEVKQGIMDMVADAAAKDSSDIRKQLQEMAAQSIQKEEEYDNIIGEYRKKMADITSYEKQYGATSKAFSRMQSDSDHTKNKLAQLEEDVREFKKEMKTFASDAEQHVKVLGSINELQQTVTRRQDMSDETENRMNATKNTISQFQTDVVPTIKSALAEAKSLCQDSQRNVKVAETLANHIKEHEDHRHAQMEEVANLKAAYEMLTNEAQTLQPQDGTTPDQQDAIRFKKIEEELATLKMLLEETQGRLSIKTQSKHDLYELIKDMIRRDITKTVAEAMKTTERGEIGQWDEAKMAGIIKNYAPTEARVEQMIRHLSLSKEEVTRILQSENEIYDKEMLKLIEDKQDAIFEKMQATELVKQLEKKCNEMVEDISTAQAKFDAQETTSQTQQQPHPDQQSQQQAPRHPPTSWAQNASAFISPPRQQTTNRMAGYTPRFSQGTQQYGDNSSDESTTIRRNIMQEDDEGSYMKSLEGYFDDGTPYFIDLTNGYEEYIPLHHYPKRPDLAGMKVPSETECRRMQEQFERNHHKQQYGPSPNSQQGYSPDRNPNHQSRGTEYRQAGTTRMQRMLIPKNQRAAWYLMVTSGQPQLQ